MTGRYSYHVGISTALGDYSTTGLDLAYPTIAEKLKQLGYSTHMAGK